MPVHDIHRVLAAEAVSNFGSMLSRLAIPFLAALHLQASAAQMAALLVADVLAAAFGGLWLAGWIDRRSKRAVMLLADGARCLLLATLALLTWAGTLHFTVLLLASAASGVMTVAFELARSAWMAQQLPHAQLPQRNAQLSVVASLSETAAFAIGGWLYQGLGAAWALAVDALSYAASALCLRGVDAAASLAAPTQASAWQAMKQDVAAGWAAIAAQPSLRALTGVEALLGFAMALTGTAYMIYVVRDVALAPGPLGVIAATGALGAVAGGACAGWLGRRFGPATAITLGLAGFAVGTACIPMAQSAGWVAIAWLVAQQIVGDAGHTLYAVHDRTLRQTAVSGDLLARVDAAMRGAGQVASLAGALVGGVLGTASSARTVLWLAAATAGAAAALAWLKLRQPQPGKPG